MITSELNKRAWAIRKSAAKKWDCRVSEIAWGDCLKLAKEGRMKGTEKQVAWATKIRDSKFNAIELRIGKETKDIAFWGDDEDCKKYVEKAQAYIVKARAAMAMLQGESATYWIENREKNVHILIKNILK